MTTAGSLKQLKDEMSADLTAFKKKVLDLKTDHHDLTKAETKEIVVLTKATVGALKLEQSAKEVAQRPPPGRDKHATIQYGRKSKRRCDRGESMLWLAASYLEHKASSQEGVMNFHLYLCPISKSLERVGTVQTQYQKHYANDADELERYGFYKKSKARVTKHDHQSKEHHHEERKHLPERF